MDIAVICFTKSGLDVVGKIKKNEWKLSEYSFNYYCKCNAMENENIEIAKYTKKSVSRWAKQHFEKKEALVFVGAVGIAVRAVSALVSDKLEDSPVIVIDDKGQYVIPILSGHVGGANEIAGNLAKVLEAIPVITTSTDIHNMFSVDVFAGKNNLRIINKEAIVKVSSRILNGEKIVMVVDDTECMGIESYEKYTKQIDVVKISDASSMKLTNNKKVISQKADVYIGVLPYEQDKEYLWLKPKEYVVGIGCKKGKSKDDIKVLVCECLQKAGIEIENVCCIASIDVKKDEEGIIELAKDLRVGFNTFSAKELQAVEGDFTESQFVEQMVGVGNVCERAAVAACQGTGQIILKKCAADGITVAVAKKRWRLDFNYE